MSDHNITIVFEDGRAVQVGSDESQTVYMSCLMGKVRIQTDCLEGACATCKGLCTQGEYRLDEYSEEALTPEEAAKGYVLTCQMHALSDCVIEYNYDSSLALKTQPEARPGRVTEIEEVAENVHRLVVEPGGDGPEMDFLPGQYVHLAIPGTEERRSYSFSNGPEETGKLEFFIKVLENGVMSDYVSARAKVGDEMPITGPFGRFYLRPPKRPLLMVAGGTGLAPMLSMLDHLVAGGGTDQPIRLLLGANSPAELFGRDRLGAYRDKGLDLTTEMAVVAANGDWDGAVGHVTDMLRYEMIDPAPDVYLCGPPPMIDAGTSWLASHNLDEALIHNEKFLPS